MFSAKAVFLNPELMVLFRLACMMHMMQVSGLDFEFGSFISIRFLKQHVYIASGLEVVLQFSAASRGQVPSN